MELAYLVAAAVAFNAAMVVGRYLPTRAAAEKPGRRRYSSEPGGALEGDRTHHSFRGAKNMTAPTKAPAVLRITSSTLLWRPKMNSH
jgi:hypothetical protein